MKKIVLFILVVLLVVSGFYFYSTGKKGQKPLGEKVKQVVEEKKQEAIRDLITKNVSLKCAYEIEGTKVTTYIKGKDRIRTTVETKEGGVNESIFDGKKIYSWEPKRKEGIVMSVDLIKSQQNKTNKVEDPETQIEKMEKFKARCEKVNFSDSVFNPPTDVKFQDFDKLQQMMQQENFQIPEVNKEE